MSKYIEGGVIKPYVAIKKYKDGGEASQEFFATQAECLAWIRKQPQPTDDSWAWYVGAY